MTLDGLQYAIDHALNIKTWKNGKRANNIHDVHMVRYADDFIITASNPGILTNVIIPVVSKFLQRRGLELSEEKTKVVHINEGFDFLGQNVRKYKGKLLIKPSKNSIQSIKNKLKKIIATNRTAKTVNLIGLLNPVIRGWANYHRHIVAKEAFNDLDRYIFRLLWTWACRRHPKKNKHWIKYKYFKCFGLRHWVFCALKDTGKYLKLVYSDINIVRHVKIKSDANPYLAKWNSYFAVRMNMKLPGSTIKCTALASA